MKNTFGNEICCGKVEHSEFEYKIKEKEAEYDAFNFFR